MKKIALALILCFGTACADLKPYYASVDAANKVRGEMFTKAAEARIAEAKAQEELARALTETAKSDKASDAVRMEAVRQVGVTLLVAQATRTGQSGSGTQTPAVSVPPPPDNNYAGLGLEILKLATGGFLTVWSKRIDKDIALGGFDRDVKIRESEFAAFTAVATGSNSVAIAAVNRPSSTTNYTSGASMLVGGGTLNNGTLVSGNNNRVASPDTTTTTDDHTINTDNHSTAKP